MWWPFPSTIASKAFPPFHSNPAAAGFRVVERCQPGWPLLRDLATMVTFTWPLPCLTDRSGRFPCSTIPGKPFMQEINPINNLIKDLSERTDVLRGYL
ncbi:hypothetical protein GCM10007160_26850 [Litchfieldella qijiaojingensis]|uniref:Uncharacterized protein n=1 Tax=Litchfieldella qijiaojingensis TaxID=980347 RepID=A0ABQ2YYP7_9GAMM|nr:hypothetical protein GCM10007160_26850 [Halomonas qijiaojingensis]